MYYAADVWTYRVDGSVGAETSAVDPQVGGALIDHIPYDVELHLWTHEQDRVSGCVRNKTESRSSCMEITEATLLTEQ